MNAYDLLQKLRSLKSIAILEELHVESSEHLHQCMLDLMDLKGHKSIVFPSGVESTACITFMGKEFTATAFGDSYEDAEDKASFLAVQKVFDHVRNTLRSSQDLMLQMLYDL